MIRTRLLIPLFVLPFILHATEPPPPEVETELLTLALFEPVTDLYFFDGEEVKPFRSVPRGFGIPTPYKGPAELILHRNPEAFLPEILPVRPAARITLPKGSERVLILTGQTQTPPLNLKAIPLDSSKVDTGEYFVFNLSSKPIALKIGNQQSKIASGATARLSDPQWKKETLDLPVYMGYYVDEELRTYSSVWGHRPVRRNFLFIVEADALGGPLKIRRTYDTLPRKN
ncbi:hypothetical protein P3T73_03580 [Kiritimatiellota bacterium B12222]|nr:hypothetical protein P3T73_03580 [Kiritimatiellota bacterium B12222]